MLILVGISIAVIVMSVIKDHDGDGKHTEAAVQKTASFIDKLFK